MTMNYSMRAPVVAFLQVAILTMIGAGPAIALSVAITAFRGGWSSTVTYTPGQVVTYKGASYICLAANLGASPTANPKDWSILDAPGATGPAGPDGPKGPQGATGLTGPQGATGATGAVGPRGVAGPAGATGPRGIQGPVGPAGPTGPQGLAGATGATGLQGAQGPAGPTGPRGPTGAQGATGPAGPGAPLVKDSTGQVVGTYMSLTVVPGSDYVSYDFVFIRTFNMPFAIPFSTSQLGASPGNSVPFISILYYASADCSGAPYFNFNGDATLPTAVTVAGVGGTTAYVVGTQYSTFTAQSQNNLTPGGAGTCYSRSVPITGNYFYPVVATYDLSTLNLVPPFSVQ